MFNAAMETPPRFCLEPTRNADPALCLRYYFQYADAYPAFTLCTHDGSACRAGTICSHGAPTFPPPSPLAPPPSPLAPAPNGMAYKERVSALLRRDTPILNASFDPIGACADEIRHEATLRARVHIHTNAPVASIGLSISCYYNGLIVLGARRRMLQATTNNTFTVLIDIIIEYERAAIVNATQAVIALSNETVVAQILRGDQQTLEQAMLSFTYEQLAEISTVLAASKGDPHLQLAYGGSADFRGRDGAYYALLSTPQLAVNVRISAADFVLHGVLVHGTFITEVHLLTPHGPAASFWASEVGEANFGWRMVNSTCDGRKWNHQYIHTKRSCDVREAALAAVITSPALHVANVSTAGARGDYELSTDATPMLGEGTEGKVQIELEYSTLSMRTRDWHVRVVSQPVYARVEGPMHRLDVSLKPSTRLAAALASGATTSAHVCTHGLVGQSFTSPHAPRVGRRDVYPVSDAPTQVVLDMLLGRPPPASAPPTRLIEFTTRAMAEGAIDGHASDYELSHARSTSFRFSCFASDG